MPSEGTADQAASHVITRRRLLTTTAVGIGMSLAGCSEDSTPPDVSIGENTFAPAVSVDDLSVSEDTVVGTNVVKLTGVIQNTGREAVTVGVETVFLDQSDDVYARNEASIDGKVIDSGDELSFTQTIEGRFGAVAKAEVSLTEAGL